MGSCPFTSPAGPVLASGELESYILHYLKGAIEQSIAWLDLKNNHILFGLTTQF